MLRSVGWSRTDVSGLGIGPIFKSQPTMRDIPEDEIIQANRSGSLLSRKMCHD